MLIANKVWRDIDSTVAVNEWFDNFAQENHLNTNVQHKLNVVIDDLITNIITYAFSEFVDSNIEVKLELSRGALVITIIDNGHPFNPFEKEKPDTLLPITDRELGGLGIHLSQELMDDVSYQRADNRNIVKLVINLPDGRSA